MKGKITKILFAIVLFASIKHVYAVEPKVLVRAKVNYKFYVETEEGKDVGSLSFKVHDANDVFSYTSTYNTEGKYYAFTANTFETDHNTEYSTDLPDIFSEAEITSMSNANFTGTFNTEQFSIYVGTANYGNMNTYYKFIPLILEQIGGSNDTTAAIKKIIYGVVHVVPNPQDNSKYDVVFQLVNDVETSNESVVPFSYVTPTDSSISLVLVNQYFETQVLGTRKHFFEYDEELLESSVLNFADLEDSADDYLNRLTSVVKEDGESYTEGQERSEDDNVDDSTLALMSSTKSLPVIIKVNLPPEILNPKTNNNMLIMVVIVSLISITGIFISIVKKKRKESTI